jgi:hypothetical protein
MSKGFMRTHASRRAGEVIALAALALLQSACAPKPEPANGVGIRENALVRFVNVTTLRKPVDLYVDDAKALSDISSDEVTDYNEWLAERHDFELRTAGNAKPLATNSENLSAGERYTVVGFNKTDGTSGVAVFRENVSQPETGKARIRLIHVADGADELDVFPAGAKDSIGEGFSYKTDSSAEIDPDVTSLEIRKGGEERVWVKVSDLSLEAGRTYTIVVAVDTDHNPRAILVDSATPIREGYLTR